MKSKTRKSIEVLDQTWQKAHCRACQDVSVQPWLLSNGYIYCSRCVEELLGLGWAERMGEEQQVMSRPVEPAGLPHKCIPPVFGKRLTNHPCH